MGAVGRWQRAWELPWWAAGTQGPFGRSMADYYGNQAQQSACWPGRVAGLVCNGFTPDATGSVAWEEAGVGVAAPWALVASVEPGGAVPALANGPRGFEVLRFIPETWDWGPCCKFRPELKLWGSGPAWIVQLGTETSPIH